MLGGVGAGSVAWVGGGVLDGGRYDRGGGWGKAFGLMEGCWIYGPWRGGGGGGERSRWEMKQKKKKKSLLPNFQSRLRVRESE